MKVKVKTFLKTKDEVIECETLGILLENQLQYIENGVKVKLDLINCLMVREDNDKKLMYKFIEKEETVNKIFINNPNVALDISIFTDKFKKYDNCCDIEYELIFEKVKILYSVSWEEI